MRYLLPQRLAVVQCWARRRGGPFRSRAEEEPTPAPRRIIPASPEHRDKVIPSISGRRLHQYGHSPTLNESRSSRVQMQPGLPRVQLTRGGVNFGLQVRPVVKHLKFDWDELAEASLPSSSGALADDVRPVARSDVDRRQRS